MLPLPGSTSNAAASVMVNISSRVVPMMAGSVSVLLVRVWVPISETRTASEFPMVVPPGSVSVFVAA